MGVWLVVGVPGAGKTTLAENLESSGVAASLALGDFLQAAIGAPSRRAMRENRGALVTDGALLSAQADLFEAIVASNSDPLIVEWHFSSLKSYGIRSMAMLPELVSQVDWSGVVVLSAHPDVGLSRLQVGPDRPNLYTPDDLRTLSSVELAAATAFAFAVSAPMFVVNCEVSPHNLHDRVASLLLGRH